MTEADRRMPVVRCTNVVERRQAVREVGIIEWGDEMTRDVKAN